MTDIEYIAMRLGERAEEGARPRRWQRLLQVLAGQRAQGTQDYRVSRVNRDMI